MNKNTIIGIVTVVLAVGGYFYYKNINQGVAPLYQVEQTATLPASTDSEEAVAVAGTIVSLTNAGYLPTSVTIKKGETVTFKNNSTVQMWTASAMHPAHTAYSGTSLSEHCPDVANTSFDACRGYLPGESWSFKFDKVGTWKYHNHLDPKQYGAVVVE